MQQRVEVFQIETRNPHFHEDKGSDHLQEMRLQALNSLYHSPICPNSVKDEIVEFLREQRSLGADEEPPEERTYPPLIGIDWDQFLNVLGDEAETFAQVEELAPRRCR